MRSYPNDTGACTRPLEEGLDRVWTPVVTELVFDTKFAVTLHM